MKRKSKYQVKDNSNLTEKTKAVEVRIDELNNKLYSAVVSDFEGITSQLRALQIKLVSLTAQKKQKKGIDYPNLSVTKRNTNQYAN